MRSILWSTCLMFAMIGSGGDAGGAQDPNPTQTIGSKACGPNWVGYGESCPWTDTYPIVAPKPKKFVVDRPFDGDCVEHQAIAMKEDSLRRRYAVTPSKETIEALSPVIHLGQALGLVWGCGESTLDQFIFSYGKGDSCALGFWDGCTADWNPPVGTTFSGKPRYSGPPIPLQQRLSYLYGLQDEFQLPPEMRASDADCSGAIRGYYERLGPFQTDPAFRAHYSVICVSRGLNARWPIAPPIEMAPCDSTFDKSVKGKLCETVKFEVDGEKIVIRANRPEDRSQFTLRQTAGGKINCDIRLVQMLAAAPDDPQFRLLTKQDLQKLRHGCLVGAAFYSTPAVSAWFKGVADRFDAIAARMK